METTDIQQKVHEFETKEGWLDQSPFYAFTLLTEEIGELGREMRRIEKGRAGHENEIYSEKEKADMLASELGDVLFSLAKIANFYQMDFGEAFQLSLNKMNDRFEKKE
jgi:NTP pyrophosphatase (non-canonical NTP hydrolase)